MEIMEQVSIGHQDWGEFYKLFAAKFLPWLVFWFVLKLVFSIGCVEGGSASTLSPTKTKFAKLEGAYPTIFHSKTLHEGFYPLWNAKGVVVGDTEGPLKCFAGVYYQLLTHQWHIRGKARSRLDCGGAFHVSPPWVERDVHDQIEVVGFQ
ncbi:hypothetical protein HKD37_06G016816 [Glycine soja]